MDCEGVVVRFIGGRCTEKNLGWTYRSIHSCVAAITDPCKPRFHEATVYVHLN